MFEKGSVRLPLPDMQILDQYGRSFPTAEERADALPPNFRADNWVNNLTGVGSQVDKVNGQHGRFFPTARVLDQELTNLRNGSDLAAHVVDRRPEEMFRRGYDIESDDLTSSQTEAVREYATDVLDLDTNLREGFRWGRLYGGCLLLLNVDDGGYPWEPLDEDNIKSFNSVSLIDRRFAYVQSQYSSMNGSHYGRPEIYLISNAVAVSGWNSRNTPLKKKSGFELMKEGGQATLVHESRVLRFDGNDADILTRQSLAGWSWSVLQRVYNAMRQFEHAFDSVGYLLGDASQGVFKLQGLIKAITSGQRAAFVARLQMMEMTRSVIRGVAIDAGDGKNGAEEFTRVATPLGGISDILDKMMLRFAAACEEPSTILFGRAPGGLNAAGDNELRSWYDTIGSEQENKVTPRAKRVYRLIAKATQGPIKGGKDARFKIHHKPLWTPTDGEVATTLFTNAQRDNLYLTQGVVKAEEVAVDLGDVYPNLDVEAREDVLKAKDGGGIVGPPGTPPAPGAPPIGGAPTKGGKLPTAFGQGPVSPTTAAGINGTAGEPAGGPNNPFPLFGGGSIGAAKPSKGKPPAALGVPDNLRRPSSGPIPKAQQESFKENAHDPKQPKDGGKFAAHTATGMGEDAFVLGDAAKTSVDHLEAATAHAHAALEFRQLASRHARIGNDIASKRHELSAALHDKHATAHTMMAGSIARADDQERVPAGSPEGGEFMGASSGSGVIKVIKGADTGKGYGGVKSSLIHEVHEYNGSTGLKAIIHRTDGIKVYKYTDAHLQKSADAKFARAADMAKALPAMRETVARDLHSTDPKTRDAATVTSLIDQHTIRNGGSDAEERTGSRGASTLEAQHVHDNHDGTVNLKFPGKSGHAWDVHVTNPETAAAVLAASAGKPAGAKLFAATNNNAVNDYIKAASGKDISAKDFRTFHANRLMLENLGKQPAPKNPKEVQKNIKTAVEQTAHVLGHTPAVSRSSYINPAIIDAYETAHAARTN
jgi:phage-related protein (TIGR01555 family)